MNDLTYLSSDSDDICIIEEVHGFFFDGDRGPMFRARQIGWSDAPALPPGEVPDGLIRAFFKREYFAKYCTNAIAGPPFDSPPSRSAPTPADRDPFDEGLVVSRVVSIDAAANEAKVYFGGDDTDTRTVRLDRLIAHCPLAVCTFYLQT
jgi:hypothetical protein